MKPRFKPVHNIKTYVSDNHVNISYICNKYNIKLSDIFDENISKKAKELKDSSF